MLMDRLSNGLMFGLAWGALVLVYLGAKTAWKKISAKK